MIQKINEIVDAWNNRHGNSNDNYPQKRIVEIATNCVSLSEAWLNRIKEPSTKSFEIVLYNKNGVMCHTLHGITKDNVADAMFNVLIYESYKYSKMVFNEFKYENGSKSTNLVGELEIC